MNAKRPSPGEMGRMTFEDCKEHGFHLTSCDRDGYCNYCGHQEPADFEPCGDCGYDHDYDYEMAAAWHLSHPCSYCRYNDITKEHGSDCPTMKAANDTH